VSAAPLTQKSAEGEISPPKLIFSVSFAILILPMFGRADPFGRGSDQHSIDLFGLPPDAPLFLRWSH
jgi:hypothetical protein